MSSQLPATFRVWVRVLWSACGQGEMVTGLGGHTSAQPSALPTDFVPIDLDEWWAQQFLARITNCS